MIGFHSIRKLDSYFYRPILSFYLCLPPISISASPHISEADSLLVSSILSTSHAAGF